MITSKDMQKEHTLQYGEQEWVYPSRPESMGELPPEWVDKLTPHRFEAPTATVVRKAELAGPNLAGFRDGDLILPVGYYGRLDLWSRNYPYFEMATMALQSKAKHLDSAFVMAGVWSSNYFHWVLDHLPTLQAWYAYRDQTGEEPTILLAPGAPSFATQSLEALGLSYIVADVYHYQVDRLLVPTWPRQDGYIRPSAVQFVRSKLAFEQQDRLLDLYVSRKNSVNRNVVNEEQITGLQHVCMEDYSFHKQRSLISQTMYMAGPHGAGLANMVWGYKMGVVEIGTPAYVNPCLWLVACALGHRYGYVEGEPVGREDIRVDPERIYDCLSLISSP